MDSLPGAGGLFRLVVVPLALVSMAGAASADPSVRQAFYQENANPRYAVHQVSYDAMVANSTAAKQSSTVSASGKRLRWISASAPESREMKQRSEMSVPFGVSDTQGIRLVSSEESIMDNTPVAAPVGDLPGVGDDGGTSALEIPTMGLNNVEMPEMEMPSLPGENSAKDSVGGGQLDGNQGVEPTTPEPRAIGKTQSKETTVPSTKLPTPGVEPARPNNMPDSWKKFTPKVSQDNSCPKVRDMKRIDEITNNISAPDGNFPIDCPLASKDEMFPVRQFASTHFTWTASNLCHNPLYFQQPAVERYGHSAGPILQPLLSGAEFIVTIPCLPYLMAMDPVNECQYPLGYYRPGSCAPYKWNPVPFTLRAAIAEGGIATALVFLIP